MRHDERKGVKQTVDDRLMKNVNPKGVFSHNRKRPYVLVIEKLREFVFLCVRAKVISANEHKKPRQNGEVVGRKEGFAVKTEGAQPVGRVKYIGQINFNKKQIDKSAVVS